jgi:hypothetical protein
MDTKYLCLFIRDIIIISASSRPALGSTHLLSNEYRRLFHPGPEADHSPPASAEVKKMWIYTSIPPYSFTL